MSEEYTEKVISTPPTLGGQDYVNWEFGLPNTLSNGAFADRYSNDISTIPKPFHAALLSSIIDYLWNQQRVVLIKVDEKSLRFNPCPDRNKGGISKINNKAIWCNPEGVAHVLVTWPERMTGKIDVNAVDKLADYALSIELLQVSADRSQAARGFLPNLNNVDFALKQLQSGDSKNPLDLVGFTTPVCDMRK